MELTLESNKNYNIVKKKLNKIINFNLDNVINTLFKFYDNKLLEKYIESDITNNDITNYINISQIIDLNNKLLNTLNKKRVYQINRGNINFIFEFVYDKNKNYDFDRFIKRFDLFCKISPAIKNLQFKEFKIYFLMYDINRFCPNKIRGKNGIEKYSKLGYCNCSSGYTYVAKLIMLNTRLPELMGLFTHEVGHLFGWDFSNFKINNNLLNNLPLDAQVKNKFNISEAINNFTTTIIHSACNAIEVYYNYKKIDIRQLFNYFLNIEYRYIIYHSAKILWLANFNSYDEFFILKNKIYYQQAFLFEYTIMRLLMFKYIKEFMKFVIDDNKFIFNYKNIDLINVFKIIFNNTDHSFKDELNYYIEIIKNEKIINMEYFCIDLKIENLR